jgi:hypothetical protein
MRFFEEFSHAAAHADRALMALIVNGHWVFRVTLNNAQLTW